MLKQHILLGGQAVRPTRANQHHERRGLHTRCIRSSSVQMGGSNSDEKRPVLRRVTTGSSELAQAAVDTNVGSRRASMELHEELSNEEMMERIEFLKRLPHKLLRDIGYTIAGPSLLSTSKELPIVNPSMLGGSSDQWPSTKAWLQHLSVPAVEEWFASHPRSQRLGDHFARCIEYVLRHSPNVEVQHLHTSTQVLERVTEPLRKSKALKALLARTTTTKPSPSLDVAADAIPEELLARTTTKPAPPLDVADVIPEELLARTTTKPTPSLDVTADAIPEELLARTTTKPAPPLDVANAISDGEKVGKRKRKLLKKLERIQLLKGRTNTIGEFDYLFETHAGELHHWEVSVKFLLYAGPWEVFGLQSPKESGDIVEGDAFLGCYLGPHVGETLFDRKARLCNQLALSRHPCAAILLHNLYVADKGEDVSTPTTLEGEDVCTPTTLEGEDGEEPQPVLVVPSALLKGYLFYEYKLWRFLKSSNASSIDAITQCEIWGERASLNKMHSMGWWTRDLEEFGSLPEHINNKWYIVPKLEWLSPVVIPSWEADRSARVLELHEFLHKADQVAKEAACLQMSRKRRFLVVELRWEPNWKPTTSSVGEGDCGAWVEVSRGFVVEDSWPDSKLYKPHGYVVTWSSSLQGLA